MSLGSGTIPLDWYSKSQDKKLRELDSLYQELLDSCMPDTTGMTRKEEIKLVDYILKKYRRLTKLRIEIGFIK